MEQGLGERAPSASSMASSSSSSSEPAPLLPENTTPLALDASRTLLALIYSQPNKIAPRLRTFAAVSMRVLLDRVLPDTSGKPIAVRLSARAEAPLLAWADDAGGLRAISLFDGTNRLSVRLASPCTALAWHGDGMVVSGDARGEVRLWRADRPVDACDDDLKRLAAWAEDGGDPSSASDGDDGAVLLSSEGNGSAIVQLECDESTGRLLASTWVRTTLLHLPAASNGIGSGSNSSSSISSSKAVGKAKRNEPLGACFLGCDGEERLRVCPEADIVAARPGRRLWLVDAEGSVLSTLKLPEPEIAVRSETPTTNDAGGAAVAATAAAAGFGRLSALMPFGCLLSWGEELLCRSAGGRGAVGERSNNSSTLEAAKSRSRRYSVGRSA